MKTMTKAQWDTYRAGRTAFAFRTQAEAEACVVRRLAIGMTQVETAAVTDESGDTRYCVAFAPKAVSA